MWIFQPIASIYFCSCIHTNAIFVCKRNRKSSLWVHSSIDEHSDNIDTDTCIYEKKPDVVYAVANHACKILQNPMHASNGYDEYGATITRILVEMLSTV